LTIKSQDDYVIITSSEFDDAKNNILSFCHIVIIRDHPDVPSGNAALDEINALLELPDGVTDEIIDAEFETVHARISDLGVGVLTALASWRDVEILRRGYRDGSVDDAGDFLIKAFDIQKPYADKVKRWCVEVQEREDREAAALAKTPVSGTAFPPELRAIGGVIGDIVKLCVDTAKSPQPFLALGAAIALVGTLAGRKYRTKSNLRSNVYAIGIADSGGGKDHARVILKEALFQADLTDYLGGGKIASGSGLLTSLERHPCRLFLLDEMGKFIKSVTGPRVASHREEIWTYLTELYTSANSRFLGSEYSDQKLRPRIDIVQPCCSIYGVTVPSVFWSTLESGALIDGSLARFLIFQTDNDYPDRQYEVDTGTTIPDCVISGLKAIVAGVGTSGDMPELSDMPPNPYTVPTTPAADVLLRKLTDEQTYWLRSSQGTSQTAVIARMEENINKVALILAISDSPDNPLITELHVTLAQKLVGHCMRALLRDADRFVAENVTESNNKRVKEIIKKAGTDGITKGALIQKTRFLQPKELDTILRSMMESDEITAHPLKTAPGPGRPGVRYVIARGSLG
jgi:Protein of unknown function (DUF3987)